MKIVDVLFCLFLLVLSPLQATAQGGKTTYKAAVVEYHTEWDHNLDVETNTLNNARKYVEILDSTTKKNGPLDIIVFPEIGLTGFNTSFYTMVPKIGQLPPVDLAVLHELSEGARTHKAYVVVNLQEIVSNPNESVKRYNTDVVFNRDGRILARYRKYNLFGEHHLDKPTLERIAFDTDFNVTFGIFTCFDILFKEPALGLLETLGVKDIVYPTAWFSELPFLTANQQQNGWSFANNVNLLASGWVNTATASGGTGIYFGRSHPTPLKNYIFSTVNENQVVVSDVLIHTKSGPDVELNNEVMEDPLIISYLNSTVKVLHEDLSIYETFELPYMCESQFKKVTVNGVPLLTQICVEKRLLCHRGLCCNFIVKLRHAFIDEKLSNKLPTSMFLLYRLLSFNGVRSFKDVATGGAQTCGVVPCLQQGSLDSCGHVASKPTTSPDLSIKVDEDKYLLLDSTIMTFKVESHLTADYIAPNVILASTDPLHFSRVPDRKDMEFHTNPQMSVLVVNKPGMVGGGLFGRVFSRDGQPPTTGQSSKVPTNAWMTVIFMGLSLSL